VQPFLPLDQLMRRGQTQPPQPAQAPAVTTPRVQR